jgi:DNA-binding NarL/FixJ family response regulator
MEWKRSARRKSYNGPDSARHRTPGAECIEAARQIRKVAPDSKIMFLSQEFSPDVVEEALRLGALGNVVKTQATKVIEGRHAPCLTER